MTLPIGLSVPHAGLEIPDSVAKWNVLSPEQIAADGDVGAREIYRLSAHVSEFVTTPIARAFVDLNRAPDDFRKDGVVKTHTCWDEPVYSKPLSDETIGDLLGSHYYPYHDTLRSFRGAVKLGVDCHTMASHGPPVGPDPGQRRPMICLGDGDGACPRPWIEALRDCFVRSFGEDVTINEPFRGGFITRDHGRRMPWVQVEMSRSEEMSLAEKRRGVLDALTAWCALELPEPSGRAG